MLYLIVFCNKATFLILSCKIDFSDCWYGNLVFAHSSHETGKSTQNDAQFLVLPLKYTPIFWYQTLPEQMDAVDLFHRQQLTFIHGLDPECFYLDSLSHLSHIKQDWLF